MARTQRSKSGSKPAKKGQPTFTKGYKKFTPKYVMLDDIAAFAELLGPNEVITRDPSLCIDILWDKEYRYVDIGRVIRPLVSLVPKYWRPTGKAMWRRINV